MLLWGARMVKVGSKVLLNAVTAVEFKGIGEVRCKRWESSAAHGAVKRAAVEMQVVPLA